MARLTATEQSRLYRRFYRLVLFNDGFQHWVDFAIAEELLGLPPKDRVYESSMKTPMRTLRQKMASEAKRQGLPDGGGQECV